MYEFLISEILQALSQFLIEHHFFINFVINEGRAFFESDYFNNVESNS